jgi:hypothetical protein
VRAYQSGFFSRTRTTRALVAYHIGGVEASQRFCLCAAGSFLHSRFLPTAIVARKKNELNPAKLFFQELFFRNGGGAFVHLNISILTFTA